MRFDAGAADPRRASLVGMPGSGKTAVGRLLADYYGCPFFDTDEMIAARFGMPASEVFSRFTEKRFREFEKEAVRELPPVGIAATGGGAVIAPENIARLRERGPVVYLKAAPARLAKNVGDGSGRPLLAGGDAEAKLAALFEARRGFYESAADYTAELGETDTEQDMMKLITTILGGNIT